MLAVLLAGTPPALASTDTAAEADLVGRVNAERNTRGLPALQVRSDLQAVARQQAKRMADRGRMSHNPNLGSEVCCWRKVGENVGYGSDTGTIHRTMMGSSHHRTNILDPDFTEIGVGVERRGDTIWVSEVFRQPEGAPQPPPPPPQPEPEPEAHHEPEPPPAPRSEPPPAPEPEAPEPEAPESPAPEPEAPPPAAESALDPVRPCQDATSVALARTLSTQTADRAGEVLATLCPSEPTRTVGLQR